MAVYTTVSAEELTAWLTRYALGTVLEFEPIVSGIENTNYFVSGDHGRFVLTLYARLPPDVGLRGVRGGQGGLCRGRRLRHLGCPDRLGRVRRRVGEQTGGRREQHHPGADAHEPEQGCVGHTHCTDTKPLSVEKGSTLMM